MPKKKEFAIYARPTWDAARYKWLSVPEQVRVMARAEGYAMVRLPGAMPFVVSERALSWRTRRPEGRDDPRGTDDAADPVARP